ncbi:MAG: electron transfer flavoprotein subunit alpha/FixB family protein [Clostridiales bacterium]|jgi:electron transfer flavoprotein alpha subunit|nr:electron transfer flavoprotein subunit alpha/FixB family protein [Clostridiales bacterium]
MKKSILIYLQFSVFGGLLPVCSELIGEALRLKKAAKNTRIYGVIIAGNGTFGGSEKLSEELNGLDAVYVYEGAEFQIFDALPYAVAVKACVEELRPDVFLAGGTPEGRAVAPATAAFLKTGATADCTAFEMNGDGELLQIRPAFGGQTLAEIVTPMSRPQIATARAGVFATVFGGADLTRRSEIRREEADAFAAVSEKTGVKRPIVVRRRADAVTANAECKFLEKRIIGGAEEEFSEGDAVIAVGGGLRGKEDLEIFRNISEKFGAALMCSRMITERGWLPRSRQIGLSGRTVSPRLLIAFGISGSAEFLSGIKKNVHIIAVNNNPDAPVMRIADEAIAGDMYAVAAALAAKIENGRSV